eukprot:469309-Amorphochlora_amoeboformis.AAC.1
MGERNMLNSSRERNLDVSFFFLLLELVDVFEASQGLVQQPKCTVKGVRHMHTLENLIKQTQRLGCPREHRWMTIIGMVDGSLCFVRFVLVVSDLELMDRTPLLPQLVKHLTAQRHERSGIIQVYKRRDRVLVIASWYLRYEEPGGKFAVVLVLAVFYLHVQVHLNTSLKRHVHVQLNM